MRRYVTDGLLALVFASCAIYALFLRPFIARTEGRRPAEIGEFAHGAVVTHAFFVEGEILHGVSVQMSSDRPASSRVVVRLLRLYAPEPGAEDNLGRYTETYRWIATIDTRSGQRWQRIEFPAVADSNRTWYALDMRLLDPLRPDERPSDARPAVTIMASEDNPEHGGKLWVDGVRQPGSLYIRVDTGSLFEWWHLTLEPHLPRALRYHGVQLAVGLLLLASVVIVSHEMLFATPSATGATAFQFTPVGGGISGTLWAVAQISLLATCLALFFLVPYAPAQSLPMFPELVMLGALGVIGGLGVWSRDARAIGAMRRDERLFWSLFAAGVGYLVVRAILSGVGHDFGYDPCGAVAPSPFVRWECRLQASFLQNYAWMSVSGSVLTLCVGVAAAVMSRKVADFWRWGLTAIVLLGVAHAATGIVAVWFLTPQILPKWIMMNSYGFNQFTYLIPYPGYVWPQLTPAFAIALWQAGYGARTRDRIAGACAAVLIAFAICGTKQRGGLLVVGVLTVAAVAARVVARRRSAESTTDVRPLTAAAAVLTAAALAPLLAIRSTMFYEPARYNIWKTIISSVVRQHPFLGFGYARWPEWGAVARGKIDIAWVSETAHNSWARVLFELGPLGLLLVVACFVFALIVMFENVRGLQGGKALIAFAATGFLICSVLEEVDGVRPVFVAHAFAAGLLCGLPFGGRPSPEPAVAVRDRRLKHSMLAVGLFCLALALLTREFFTFGAFEFEGVGPRGEPKQRLLSQYSTIPVYGPQPLWVFKAAPLNTVGKLELIAPSRNPIAMDVAQPDQAYLPMATKRRFWPERYTILFARAYDGWFYQLGGKIVYPPLPLSLPLAMTRGAADPRPAPDGVAIACVEDCTLAFLTTRTAEEVVVLDLTPLRPIEDTSGVAIEADTFAAATGASPIALSRGPATATTSRTSYAWANGSGGVTVTIPAGTAWYKLHITTNVAKPDPPRPVLIVVIRQSASTSR